MNEERSDLLIGLLMGVLGLIGLLAASGARDNEMYVFGLSLAGFATVFVLGLIRRHYDRVDAARAAVRAQTHE